MNGLNYSEKRTQKKIGEKNTFNGRVDFPRFLPREFRPRQQPIHDM